MAEKYPQEHWERVAKVYEDSPASPSVAISEQFGVPAATARGWVLRLRRDGLIPATSHGRTSEQHDRVTRIAADLKVGRHELAQAVLRHIPSGRLHITKRDATPPAVLAGFGATFGGVVRKSREVRGWTQAELANRVSATLGRVVSPLTVTRTEAGARPVPLDEVAAFAAVLDLSIDELLRMQVVAGDDQ